MYKILIVEDDETISSILEEHLNKWGYKTSRVVDFSNVLSIYTSFEPHLVLMDINLPFYDGYYWCTRFREFSNLPIVFISSRDSDADKIRAISQGADDYIEKPFSMDLLIAKTQATLRRAYSYINHNLDVLQHRDLLLNAERQQMISGEQQVELTRNECRILTLLVRNQGNVVSRTRLIKALWNDESFVDDNTLTVNVNRLRKKMEIVGLGEYIKTIKGEGYRLL
ncbi:response regulator transcription factor [Anaerobacillus sp. CMMVII]|uniref:response regulator transcription factor n=1 Tax=Anaerobacillus sp. CMMVII TaxID=2755588 RepID=UPI0021B77180|nr:response regulator transcription factor [Anaerobacillus sp. CMMVII]MCT8138014.1 response regulator transcription factor [Anaerobacillus sp. CMMVII]